MKNASEKKEDFPIYSEFIRIKLSYLVGLEFSPMRQQNSLLIDQKTQIRSSSDILWGTWDIFVSFLQYTATKYICDIYWRDRF